jgi:alkanesulfonate monooxygenase SsuD/methylene tetrahydromethanopterin reductase-like flavin-dependent oxidoreductase (luciferase family)
MTPRYGIFDWVEASSRPPAEVYEHKLELAAAAERAGFRAFLVAEHHGTPLSIDGSPSALSHDLQERAIRAGALTSACPGTRNLREVCMLDHLSYGRLELGVGRGVSPIESRIFGYNSIEE